MSLAATLAVLLVGAHSTTNTHLPSAAMSSAHSVSDAGGTDKDRAKDSAAKRAIEDTRYAKTALEGLAESYRYLDGVTVSLGTTPKGEEAIAYYTEGEIVISRAHTVSIDTILAHEIWHVIDYRDNGKLDWGENLPPRESSDYLL